MRNFELRGFAPIGILELWIPGGHDSGEFASIEPDIVSEMEKLCREEHYSMVAMLIMNPVEKNGEEIIVKGNKQIIEKAFGVTVKDDKCFIPTIMSRKKDFIPRIGRFLTG